MEDIEYRIVLEKLRLSEKWPSCCKTVKDPLITWMEETEIATLAEDCEDILHVLETMLGEDGR